MDEESNERARIMAVVLSAWLYKLDAPMDNEKMKMLLRGASGLAKLIQEEAQRSIGED